MDLWGLWGGANAPRAPPPGYGPDLVSILRSLILFKIIIYTRKTSAEVGRESEKKKATRIIFGSRLNIKKKDGKGKRSCYDRDNAI